jgi:hypothetical protein
MELVDKGIRVSPFCQNIFSHIQKHTQKFTGADGGKCVYEYTWGELSKALKKACNPMVCRETFMTTKVMRGIWDRNTNFSKCVLQVYWMDATYLLPVIAHMYKIPRLVLYNIRKLSDGTQYFTTYVYSYESESCCVSREIREGFIHDVHPSGNTCIVFIDDISHHMLFHLYDDSKRSQSDRAYAY